MINEEKVVAFVDNVLVGIKTKEGHDEIVEEVLRRLYKGNARQKARGHTGKLNKSSRN